MPIDFSRAHLYVEKYNHTQKIILLDFVFEHEFLYFRDRGDFWEGEHLPNDRYEPTMILVHNFDTKRRIREGALLDVDMNVLMKITVSNQNSNFYSYYHENRPVTVFFELLDGTIFSRIIDNPLTCIIHLNSREYEQTLFSSWEGKPCALDKLSNEFKVSVWDVGQGNTNSIEDKNNLTLFDFGASVFSTKMHHMDILYCHRDMINQNRTISLIISHWDSDHYNLLCTVDDDFLEKLCCVFYPCNIITQTAKQIMKRINNHCKYCVAIPYAKRVHKRQVGIKSIFSGTHFELFVGENSTSINKSGLLLNVWGNREAVLLTADHTNYQVWGTQYHRLNYNIGKVNVVVPHHGGYCGKTKVCNTIQPGIAAISVGKNAYKHPHQSVIDEYIKMGYEVFRTDWERKDIIIQIN